MLLNSLIYRKSFAKHRSTDVEYAVHLGAYLQARQPKAHALRLLPGARSLLRAYRALDSETRLEHACRPGCPRGVRAKAALVQRQHDAVVPGFHPSYRVKK